MPQLRRNHDPRIRFAEEINYTNLTGGASCPEEIEQGPWDEAPCLDEAMEIVQD
jgi:hypothetical protein